MEGSQTEMDNVEQKGSKLWQTNPFKANSWSDIATAISFKS